ncbi:hypothetical protein A1353_04640 [Methylomonas methanica]|uniref:Cytochrome c domain-containing protein n=1 Tax=Methylomonas methanica TaxID=421 RepID=A0A177MWF9_METMH|nr:hypothetical protein [Methylomonas methanica]OAI09603.1 hypothetical protein A1353_04640 [Methylomonas methanica]
MDTNNTILPRLLATALLILTGLFASQAAQALPSFARQTGMPCTSCHTQAFGPNLNSYGRSFKLNGYTWGGNDSVLSRFGGMAMASISNTKKNNDEIPNDTANANRGFNPNNNVALDQASLFYGGKVFGKMGAFVQFTYDGVASRFALDNTDIRIADDADWLNQNFVYGVSFNNGPTIQDIWNTTSAWSFPYASSPFGADAYVGPYFNGPAIDGVAGQLGGATLYTMINDTFFLEAGAYSSFAKYVQKGMGQWSPGGTVKVNGGAPYWRIGLQQEWKGHYVSLGHFGFRTDIQPDPSAPATDRYTDLGVDFNYQYLANPLHIYELKANYTREQQQLLAYYNQDMESGAQRINQQLGFFGLNGTYTYDQTYGITAGFNHIYGNRDSVVYSASPTNKPNSEYFTLELDYVPFGKKAATTDSYLNLKFAAQYVAYTRLNGAEKKL